MSTNELAKLITPVFDKFIAVGEEIVDFFQQHPELLEDESVRSLLDNLVRAGLAFLSLEPTLNSLI